MTERGDNTTGSTSRQAVGAEAERLASRFLIAQGLELVARNVRSRGGEIDLVMRDGDTVVFIEVRYRSDARFGSAAESVDGRKQRRIVDCAAHYLQRNPALARAPARFDVVAIRPSHGADRLEWIRNAFQVS